VQNQQFLPFQQQLNSSPPPNGQLNNIKKISNRLRAPNPVTLSMMNPGGPSINNQQSL
jgi:hypothetical protein